ncbi:DNA repair protein RAD51-like protein 4 [Picochlorum sp. SENEW3]|nr:DNA repair protein RAD51-like protein 4 [Picochlorum sp. SENEW3]WPT14916.1 DNA repair protein RAD51-like protein 4 [Picochlorum sp. SENEW3]
MPDDTPLHDISHRKLVSLLVTARGDEDVPEWILNDESQRGTLEEALHSVQARAALRMNGKDLIRSMENSRCLPLGCTKIDEMLQGGLLEGHLMEVFGDAGTGKTQLCHTAAAVTASRGERVIYIDTGNSFRASRLVSIIGNVSNTAFRRAEDALDCVTVLNVHRMDDLLHEMQQALKTSTPSMIIIDCLGSLVAPTLGGVAYDAGHDVLSRMAMHLKRIAAEHHVAVLVTNYTIGGEYGQPSGHLSSEDDAFYMKRAALGDTWVGQPHVRLQLVMHQDDTSHHQGSSRARRAFLHQSTNMPSGACVDFDIY